MIIDFHTHIFPDKLAASAIASLSANSGGVTPIFDGTAGGLTAYANANGIDHCVALSIATNAKQQTNVNNFAASVNNGMITSFGSVYPFAENAAAELDRIKELGLKGIKLHPDYQDFFVDDERLFPLYRHIARLGLITVFHSGQDIGIYEPVHCTPERLSRVLPLFEGAPVVAAHFGAYLQWYDVEKYLVGKNIYFDTAFSYGRIPYLHAKRIIETHGSDRVLFGSDMPWSASADEARFIRALSLPESDVENILWKNAAKLLDMENDL